MKAMKFKVSSPEHSEKIQAKLFEEGYAWRGFDKTVLYKDARHLFAADGVITYEMSGNEYFEDPRYKEYVLTPFGSLMSVTDYYKQPETPSKYCTGCSPLTCASGGQCDGPAEKTYEPLPLQPFQQWLGDRMKHLVEHIAHELSTHTHVDVALTRELHVLSYLVKHYEEVV